MSNVFSKKEKAHKSYYFIAERKYETVIKKYPSSTDTSEENALSVAEKFAEEMNKIKGGEGGTQPQPLNEDFFYYTKLSKNNPEAVLLPFGTYRYQREMYPIPERLEVYNTRQKETYIELPELDVLTKDLNTFLTSKDLYAELGFPYRRGYLLHGRPGNGKTALIRSLLSSSILSKAHVIWMNSLPTDEMVEALNQVDSLKVIVFEEIVNQNEQVNFDLPSLLAFMDGEASLKNCVTIATTNYPAFLGENLANRPSRFDVVLKFDDPSDKAVYQVLENLLKRKVEKSEFTNKKFSFAQIKELVLLHKMFSITLEEAAKRLEAQSKQFSTGFEKEKTYGFGMGSDD